MIETAAASERSPWAAHRTGQLGRVVARRAAEFSAPTGEIPHIPLSGGGELLKTSVIV